MALSFTSRLKKIARSFIPPETEDMIGNAEDYAALLPDLILEAQTTVQTMRSGPYHQRRPGHGDSFWQHRPYERGDSLRQIDWKASAKHGEALILQKEDEQIQNMMIHCPFTPAMDFAPSTSLKASLTAFDFSGSSDKRQQIAPFPSFVHTKFSAALFIAATLMVFFKGQRHPFTTTASPTGRLSFTDNHLWSQLEHLCSSENHAPSADAAHRQYFWIDDFWGEPETLRRALIDLKAQHAVPYIVQVITADEIDLPYKGHMLYEDMNGHDKKDIPLVEGIVDEYRARITRHLQSMDEICRSLDIYYARLILGQPRSNEYPSHSYTSIHQLLEDMMASIAVPRSGIMA